MITYFILYSTTIISAVLLFSCTNPINAVLFLIHIFLNISMIFLLINAEFIAFIFIIIYVGAIAVLFLFIVMMLNMKRIEKDNSTYLTIGSIILLLIGGQFLILIYNPEFNQISNDLFQYSNINILDESTRLIILSRMGEILFNTHAILMIIAGIILLVALLGSIFLTNTKKGFSMKKQSNQLTRIKNINHVIWIRKK